MEQKNKQKITINYLKYKLYIICGGGGSIRIETFQIYCIPF